MGYTYRHIEAHGHTDETENAKRKVKNQNAKLKTSGLCPL
jgi:hypothetical protein